MTPPVPETIVARPRASASSMGLRLACASSFAREVELESFAHAQGLSYADVTVEQEGADRGRDIHSLVQAIPVRLPEYGIASDGQIGAPRLKGALLADYLNAQIGEQGLDLDESAWWFALMATEARDALLLSALDIPAPDGGKWTKVEILLDQRTLEMPIDIDGEPEPFKARPDVVMTLEDDSGNAMIVVIDYKSGWRADQKAEWHAAQNASGVVIRADQLAREGKKVVWAFTAAFTPSNLRDARRKPRTTEPAPAPMAIDEYPPEAIAELRERAIAIQTEIHQLARRVKRDQGADGSLPEDLQSELVDRATPGSHCRSCHGKACCTKLQAHLSEAASTLNRPEWEEVHALLKPLRSTSAAKKPKPEDLPVLAEQAAAILGFMNVSQLSSALLELTAARETAQLITETGTALDTVSRATLKAKPDILPGVSLKPGKATFDVVKDAQGAEPTPQDIFAVVNSFLNQPDFRARMGGRAIDLNRFVATFATVDAVKLRKAVKVIGGFATDEEAATALAKLTGSPFRSGTKSPSVVLDPDAIRQAAALDAHAVEEAAMGSHSSSPPPAVRRPSMAA